MFCISFTLFGIAGAVVREVQPANVLDIFVTLFGIVGAVVSDWQFINVSSIFVTLFALLISGGVVSKVQP